MMSRFISKSRCQGKTASAERPRLESQNSLSRSQTSFVSVEMGYDSVYYFLFV